MEVPALYVGHLGCGVYKELSDKVSKAKRRERRMELLSVLFFAHAQMHKQKDKQTHICDSYRNKRRYESTASELTREEKEQEEEEDRREERREEWCTREGAV